MPEKMQAENREKSYFVYTKKTKFHINFTE